MLSGLFKLAGENTECCKVQSLVALPETLLKSRIYKPVSIFHPSPNDIPIPKPVLCWWIAPALVGILSKVRYYPSWVTVIDGNFYLSARLLVQIIK